MTYLSLSTLPRKVQGRVELLPNIYGVYHSSGSTGPMIQVQQGQEELFERFLPSSKAQKLQMLEEAPKQIWVQTTKVAFFQEIQVEKYVHQELHCATMTQKLPIGKTSLKALRKTKETGERSY